MGCSADGVLPLSEHEFSTNNAIPDHGVGSQIAPPRLVGGARGNAHDRVNA